jgi:hypothetical protein
MDPTLVTLAMAAASKIVTSMAGDAWEKTKARLSGLLAAEGSPQEMATLGQLEASKHELMQSVQGGDQEAVQEITQEWQARFRRLLKDRPDAAVMLRDILDELDDTKDSASQSHIDQLTISARAQDNSTVFQQGQGTQIQSHRQI